MSAARAPSVVLKLATSLDGRIALSNGASRWITGPEARAEVHRLRGQADIIVTGRGTVASDDPKMTVRAEGFTGDQPAVAIFDSALRTPPQASLFEADRKVLIFALSSGEAHAGRRQALEARGAQIEAVAMQEKTPGLPDFAEAVDRLAAKGFGRLFVEAGAALAASALRSGRVTRIEWFRAPMVLGGDARPVFADFGLETLDDAPRLIRTAVRECGPDLHETYQWEAS